MADSANIPYHLWRNHIEQVIPRIKLPADWEIIVTPLRECLLRWWRRRVTKSWGKYRRSIEYKQGINKHTSCGVRWNHQTKVYNWIIKPKDKGWKEESGYGIPQTWFTTKGRALGEAGRDCILRAIYASWWSGMQGHAPSFGDFQNPLL